jgi:hypothetical protein
MFVPLRKSFLLIFSLLIVFKSPMSWGFLHSSLQKSAVDKKLWEHPQWLSLGHYEKSIWKVSSPFRGTFFLHPRGFHSPKDELLKSIEVLFEEQERNPLQCRYPARVRWLAKELAIPIEMLNACEERQKWKQELNAQAVSLIFAASDLGNASSSFGHTFLKLINPDLGKNKDLTNYGVNYAAHTDRSDGVLYALKGLFGFYQGVFTMLPYHQKIREYVNVEGRDLWEYPLRFSPDEVDFLVDHLIEIEQASAPYYFASDNCAYQILKTLEVVRPSLKVAQQFRFFVIPIDTLKMLDRSGNIFSERIYRKSLKGQYLEGLTQLSDQQVDVLKRGLGSEDKRIDGNLTGVEKAHVIEVGTKFLALEEFRQQKSMTEDIYKLSVQRASLGRVPPLIESKVPPPPEESHDSSAFYWGFGFLGRPVDSDQSYYSFKFRTVFHDLEQIDSGAVKFSHSEMLSVDGRFFPEQERWLLDKLTVLNLLNTPPMTALDRNFAWKVRFDLLDKWNPDFEVGGGASVDIGEARLVSFLSARMLHRNSEDVVGVGPELLFVMRPFQYLGYSLGVTYFLQSQGEDFFRYTSKVDWNFAKNWDVQVGIERRINEVTDANIRFVYNFIL